MTRASNATLHALELPQFLRVLATFAATDLGRRRLIELAPANDVNELARRREMYVDGERLLVDGSLVPSSERDFAPLVSDLDRTAADLTGRDLVVIGDLLDISHRARERLAAKDDDSPPSRLATEALSLPDATALRTLIRETFDRRGEIREDASPALVQLRRRIRSARDGLYQRLGTYADEHRDSLAEDTIPMRGGRLVLMVQGHARGRLPGLLHGRSGSGKSLYFEPLETVELNNDLQQSVDDENAERRRLLIAVLERLRSEIDLVIEHTEFVALLDSLQAAVRFAQTIDAHLAELAEQHKLELHDARHPLLEPKLADARREALGTAGHEGEVIPLNAQLTPTARTLVVTGPNAGGKTVALKTVGLLALIHACGLPIPAPPGARLPFFDTIVATVGDEQDLLADRSTFSGRLLRLHEAWEQAKASALILIDELGSGTDPEEGSALSVALLENLVERQCLALITTHLVAVAASALELDGASCAAMQFDSVTGAPTYRLQLGPPGGSEALALARRLGLSTTWLERADELLGTEHRQLRRLLAEIETTRDELESTRQQLDTELADAERLRRRLAEQDTALSEERRTLEATYKHRLDTFRRQVHEQLNKEIETLRKAFGDGRRKGLAAESVGRLFTDAPVGSVEPESDGAVTVGDEVRHRALGWRGTLEKLDRGKAQVRVRGKVVRCGIRDLVPAGPTPSAKKPDRRPQRAAIVAPDAKHDARELNLIGARVEPALERLDHFLDQSLLGGSNQIRVVHGHGTGRLRAAVREHLKRHHAVHTLRPGSDHEGGNGATVVTLRG